MADFDAHLFASLACEDAIARGIRALFIIDALIFQSWRHDVPFVARLQRPIGLIVVLLIETSEYINNAPLDFMIG